MSDELTDDLIQDELTTRLRQMDGALACIFDISRVLTSPVTIEDALAAAMACLDRRSGTRHSLVVLFDERQVPQVLVGGGNTSQTFDYYTTVVQPIVSRLGPATPLLVMDAAEDPLFAETDLPAADGPVAFIAVPILNHDQVIGALTIERCGFGIGEAELKADAHFLSMVSKLIGQTHHLHLLIARDRERLMEENRREQKRIQGRQPLSVGSPGIAGIIGESPAVREVLRKIHIVARSQLPVLLRGESGTGKELFAQAVHDLSVRRRGPMVKLNCAALPETMLESELFGHERGAFTGAIDQRRGRFELADGGTLFLDEIGEISAGFQAKLLRVLQEGEFERVGGSETVKVDVRVVAATNRNLEEDVLRGTFRSDLYFRLCVVPIILSPLRERKEDIPMLAGEFLHRFNEMSGTSLIFTDEAMVLLQGCPFPGNIRELESCVRRTAAFAHGCEITEDDFACKQGTCLSSLLWKGRNDAGQGVPASPLPIVRPLGEATVIRSPGGLAPGPGIGRGDGADHGPQGSPSTVTGVADDDEDLRLREAMEKAGWVQAKAARLLGLTSRQMGYALRKHGIQIKRF